MTDREKAFFINGIMFALSKVPLERAAPLTRDLGVQVTEALLPLSRISLINDLALEVHQALDEGGFRGDDAQRRAKQ